MCLLKTSTLNWTQKTYILIIDWDFFKVWFSTDNSFNLTLTQISVFRNVRIALIDIMMAIKNNIS